MKSKKIKTKKNRKVEIGKTKKFKKIEKKLKKVEKNLKYFLKYPYFWHFSGTWFVMMVLEGQNLCENQPYQTKCLIKLQNLTSFLISILNEKQQDLSCCFSYF